MSSIGFDSIFDAITEDVIAASELQTRSDLWKKFSNNIGIINEI